ncbi:MAG: formate/nitrite transporter family protein, partial [Parasporobacterium sp.]|nr:formate/nitrite transporter family protein [Parasporobacterium sp.]
CFSNKNKPNVILIWLGNFLGAIVCCGLIRLAKPAYAEKALEMVNKKLDMNLGLVFILAIFCGILMYAAVENFRRHPNDISGIFGIVFCVAVFILAGFEHSIADMCYCVFAVNSVTMGLRILLFLVVVTAGNAVGAWAIRWLTEIAEKKKNA